MNPNCTKFILVEKIALSEGFLVIILERQFTYISWGNHSAIIQHVARILNIKFQGLGNKFNQTKNFSKYYSFNNII